MREWRREVPFASEQTVRKSDWHLRCRMRAVESRGTPHEDNREVWDTSMSRIFWSAALSHLEMSGGSLTFPTRGGATTSDAYIIQLYQYIMRIAKLAAAAIFKVA